MKQESPVKDIEFDASNRWGFYSPRGVVQLQLDLCHRLSAIPALSRLSFWLRHPLKHRLTGPVDAVVWGLKMRLMPRGNLSESRVLFMPGLFDRTERMFLKDRLRPGAVFFDIGANAGAYSFWAFSCLKTQCDIYSVEPDPELQRRIRFNADTNKAANLILIPDALSDESGEMQLVFGKGNRGQNALEKNSSTADAMTVHVRTLLDLVEQLGIRKIDALKIDIEGHEFRVMNHFFSNASKEIWPKWIICETCTEKQAEGMGNLLHSVGYSRVCSGKMNDIFEFSGK